MINITDISNEQKFKIILEVIKGNQKIAELASAYRVHPHEIKKWEKQFIENGALVFSLKNDIKKSECEKYADVLFKKVGEQQLEIERLKKKLNMSN